jgi:hypothetical protein
VSLSAPLKFISGTVRTGFGLIANIIYAVAVTFVFGF